MEKVIKKRRIKKIEKNKSTVCWLEQDLVLTVLAENLVGKDYTAPNVNFLQDSHVFRYKIQNPESGVF